MNDFHKIKSKDLKNQFLGTNIYLKQQPKQKTIIYLIWLSNIANRLFVFSFKNGNDDPTRNSLNKYYMPLVEIKYFNALIKNEEFFDHLLKNKQEGYEKLLEMSNIMIYTTGNLFI